MFVYVFYGLLPEIKDWWWWWIKVKEADLYSAFIEVPYIQGAQVRITQITPYLPLHRQHSPDWGCGHL